MEDNQRTEQTLGAPSSQIAENGEEGTSILSISKLKISFHTYAGEVKAIDGAELSMKKGEVLGLVGESGCGKSVTSLAIVGLLPPNAQVLEGDIVVDGQDVLKMESEQIRAMRLKEVAIVFQDPMTFLNPVLDVGSQIMEIISARSDIFTERLVKFRLRQFEERKGGANEEAKVADEKILLEQSLASGKLSSKEFKRLAKLYALAALDSVRIPEPERVLKMFPFELSGGMRQRVMIAMALERRPKLLLADEITTALDVTVQAQVLQLLKDLKKEIDLSVLLITHDLGVIAEISDRVAVMYAGSVVEVAEVNELFKNPKHPYTVGLLDSVPRPDVKSDSKEDRVSIKGSVPDLIHPPTGCRFHPRCPLAFDKCPNVKPRLIEVSPGHTVACLLFGE
jgi:peptide/nickel transport system ATP-binding protein